MGLIEGCKVGNDGLTTSLIQFADDTLFFVQENLYQVLNLRCILLMFEAASGLCVNLTKTKLIGVDRVPNLQIYADRSN